jgi:hypothetical protein
VHAETTQLAPRPRTGRSPAATVAGAAAAVLALLLVAAGLALLWGEARRGDDGYLSTAHEPFATRTHALRTDDLDVDLDGAGGLLERVGLGGVRIDVRPRNGKPAFVGIARTRDVAAYLHGTAHTVVEDVSYSPFRVAYRDSSGDAAPTVPADQGFWVASAHGPGTQSLTWDMDDGDWSVVVMNDDASRDVDARISAAAEVPPMGGAGWAAVAAGIALLAVAAALLLPALRAGRTPKETS